MRNTGPVTGREYALTPGTTLVSTTDLKGRIVHCNSAFVEVSGYTRLELQGQPHNLIRHPDVPEEAFRDLWATIQAGLPWSGLVKNRRKNGDHYWVAANATPIKEGNRIVGYLSVRTVPDRRSVEAAEALYRRMRAQETGKAPRRLALHRGRLMRAGWLGVLQRAAYGVAMHRLAVPVIALVMVAYGVGALWGETVSGAIAAALTGLTGYLVMRRALLAPVDRMLEDLRRMAAGDLNVVSQGTFGGVIGEFQSALAQLNVNLRAVVADARSEALAVESQVEEIAAGNRDMSVRTEAQAANLEQTAASVEQITATVRNNTQAAKDAVRSAESTTAVARQAHESVLSVAATIKDISTASQRIADITQVIDGISFQTNILALNAAVEAARAGESGRGFSVVAAEVRSLAQRTTEAAQEIKTLVESAHGIVDSGVQLATQAARAMNEAEAQVAETTRLIGQIELASAEQLLGVDQVNAAVTQLDGVTQRNAEMVHDLAHAAARLIERAKILTEAVQVFRVDQAPVDIPDAVELRREARRKKAEEVLASYAEASDTEA